MTSYIIEFIIQTFQLPYNEDLLRLIYENNSSCMKKVKPFLLAEIGAPEEFAKYHQQMTSAK